MPDTGYADQKASNRTPFVFSIANIALPLILSIFSLHIRADSGSETNCSAKTFHETVSVSYVYDGDTIHLSDGRKLRLIGINAPESGHDGKAGEPFHTAAKAQLQNIIRHNNGRLQLLYGTERHDRYTRVLAHIFTPDGTNITAKLLQAGLGFSLAIPPNLKFLKCYQLAENKAKQLKKGIWGHSFGKPVNAAVLSPSTLGFHQVTGTVIRIGESHSSLWLNLSKTFAIRIPKKDFIYFKNYQPASLINRQLIATSWIYKQNSEQRMTIRHPASLKILNTD